jgi:hypothetical protein
MWIAQIRAYIKWRVSFAFTEQKHTIDRNESAGIASYRCVRTPVKAQLLPVALASAQMRNPHYSITVAEVLDSPLGYLALMAVPIGLYFMFKILLWDYTVSQPSWLSKCASLLSTLSQARHVSVNRSC